MKPTIGLSAFAIGLGLAACDAQASEHYNGEPLLSLSGNVTVNALTGGLPITPALCFDNRPGELEIFPLDHVPADVVAEIGNHANYSSSMTVVDVDSVGQFPATFDVAVYLPPSEAALRPELTGEPRIAKGHVCAVRADHPEVVEAPFYSSVQRCDSGEAGPCTRRRLLATRETKRYYTESYECPNAQSERQDCLLTTAGDAGLKREDPEYVLGFDSMTVLYLADPAPADSYTAWEHGSTDTLSPGYHLFRSPSFDSDEAQCSLDAMRRAYEDVNQQFNGHFVLHTGAGIATIDPAYADAAYEVRQRRYAQYRMESCTMPDVRPVSPTEPLSITINADVPLPDAFLTLPAASGSAN